MLDGEFIEHVCDHSDRSAWNCMTLIAGKNATTTGQVLVAHNCNVTRSVSKMTEIERRGGKRWDKPKKAEKSRDCGGGKF